MTKEEFSQLKIGQSVFLVDFHEKRMREEIITEIIKSFGPGYPASVYVKNEKGMTVLRMRQEISVSRLAAWQKARRDAEKMLLDYSNLIEDAKRKTIETYSLLNIISVEESEADNG